MRPSSEPAPRRGRSLPRLARRVPVVTLAVAMWGISAAAAIGPATHSHGSSHARSAHAAPHRVAHEAHDPLPTVTDPSSRAFTDGFGALTAGSRLSEGTTVGGWTSVWNGGGSIEPVADDGPALALAPAVATTASATHSALVVSARTFADTDITMRLRTTNQLREGNHPNPWEVGWVLWHYTDSHHFYYVILKPNGWELGKEDPAYPDSQRFLATGTDKTFAVGPWHTVKITQTGPSITVAADGQHLTTFVDQERPYLSGSVGLYCEDSAVNFGAVSASG